MLTSISTSARDNYQIIKDVVKTKVLGEDELIDEILQTCFSTYTNNPQNLGIMAPSSTGKTHPISQCIRLFPEDDVWILAGATARSFIYLRGKLYDKHCHNCIEEDVRALGLAEKSERDYEKKTMLKRELIELLDGAKSVIELSRKILVFYEPPPIDLWVNLKATLSHDAKDVEFQVKIKESRYTKNIVLRGWPATVFASAKDEAKWDIWDELESRFHIVSPSMTEKKYRAAINLIAKEESLPPEAQKYYFPREQWDEAKTAVLKVKKNIDELYFPFKFQAQDPIWVPFGENLGRHYPAVKATDMREARRFYGYMKMSTLVNSERRPRLQWNDKTSVICIGEDFHNAERLFGRSSFGVTPYKSTFFKTIFLPCYEAAVDKDWILVDDILAYERKQGKVTFTRRAITNMLDELENRGLVASKQDQGDRRRNLYQAVAFSGKIGDSAHLPQMLIFEPESLKQAYISLKNISAENGIQITSSDGTPLTIEQFIEQYFTVVSSSSAVLIIPEKNAPLGQQRLEISISSSNADSPVFQSVIHKLLDRLGSDLVERDEVVFSVSVDLNLPPDQVEAVLSALIKTGQVLDLGEGKVKRL